MYIGGRFYYLIYLTSGCWWTLNSSFLKASAYSIVVFQHDILLNSGSKRNYVMPPKKRLAKSSQLHQVWIANAFKPTKMCYKWTKDECFTRLQWHSRSMLVPFVLHHRTVASDHCLSVCLLPFPLISCETETAAPNGHDNTAFSYPWHLVIVFPENAHLLVISPSFRKNVESLICWKSSRCFTNKKKYDSSAVLFFGGSRIGFFFVKAHDRPAHMTTVYFGTASSDKETEEAL